MNGKFITFEGGEGIGKSGHIKSLYQAFLDNKYDTRLFREPGGTHIGETIRHTLKHDDQATNMCSETELLLFAASRAQLVNEVIRPGLKEGRILISDRFLDSTRAYQGGGRNLPNDYVEAAIEIATQGLRPDLTFLIDCPPEQGLKNVAQAQGREGFDRLDNETLDFHMKVYDRFMELAHAEPERFSIVPYIHGDFKGMQEYMRQEIKDRLDIKLI